VPVAWRCPVSARRIRRGRHEPFIITIKAPGAKVTLTKADVVTIAQALADAGGWRRLRVDQWCARCENAPKGRCDEHLADLDLADLYQDLAAELADVLPEPPETGGAS
jgi:hypothetical protein